MSNRRMFTVLAVLLGLALFAAACGSDSDDASSESDGTAEQTEAAEAEDEAAPEEDEAEPEEAEDEDEPEEAEDAADGEEATEGEASDVPEVDTEGSGSDPSLCPTAALDSVTDPVEIEFWHAMTEANKDTLEAMLADYNASQDKVQVNAVGAPNYDDNLNAYLAALRGGDLPDMVQMEEIAMQLLVDSGSTVPIGSCIAADDYDTSDFVEPLFGQYSIGGELKTMPFQLSNPVFYYNKLNYEAAGLDPEVPPTTFDEIIEQSTTLVDSGTVPNAFALELQGWYQEQWSSMANEALVDNENGRVERARTSLLDNPTITESLAFVDTMNKEGLLLNVGPNPNGEDHLLAIAFDQAAMTIGTSAALGSIYDDIPQFPNVELGVAAMPGPADADGGVTVGGGSLYMTEDTSDEVKAAVWDLMKWLNEPDQQVRWHIGTGYIPTRNSAADDPAVQELWAERPGFKVAFDQLAESSPPPGGGGPVLGAYVEFRNALEKAIERVVNGTDVAGAQADATAESNDAITSYNDRLGF